MPCSIIERFRDLRPEADTIFSRKHSRKKRVEAYLLLTLLEQARYVKQQKKRLIS